MLTRFMGYIGVLAAALLVLPIFSPLPVIQGFWLVAVGVLIYGYWPSGRSDAWEDGTAHPWPSAAESRAKAAEAREASRNGKAG